MVVGNIDVLFSPLHCIWSWGVVRLVLAVRSIYAIRALFASSYYLDKKRPMYIQNLLSYFFFCIVRLRLGQRIPAHGPLFGHDIVFFCNLPLLENYMGFSLFSLFDKCT